MASTLAATATAGSIGTIFRMNDSVAKTSCAAPAPGAASRQAARELRGGRFWIIAARLLVQERDGGRRGRRGQRPEELVQIDEVAIREQRDRIGRHLTARLADVFLVGTERERPSGDSRAGRAALPDGSVA